MQENNGMLPLHNQNLLGKDFIKRTFPKEKT